MRSSSVHRSTTFTCGASSFSGSVTTKRRPSERYHLDTDFLVYALSTPGPERRQLRALSESDAEIEISAVAWYEFSRGPRTPEQLAVARAFFGEDGVVPFAESLAALAAEVFRRLGSPRRRAADVAIGVTAVAHEAALLTRNGRDFAGIPELRVETKRPTS